MRDGSCESESAGKKTMRTKKLHQVLWFGFGIAMGATLVTASMAAVPSRVTDDTALYESLSEIRSRRQAELRFDTGLKRLSAVEPTYRERLPSLAKHPRLKNVVKRVSNQTYKKK